MIYNNNLVDAEKSVSEEYMDFVMQFGYIVMFSSVFPLAGFFCWAFNYVKMLSLLNEFQYKRRIMPEISVGIGMFMNFLELLSKVSTVINCAICYFTSKAY
jgi:hypothetical protein